MCILCLREHLHCTAQTSPLIHCSYIYIYIYFVSSGTNNQSYNFWKKKKTKQKGKIEKVNIDIIFFFFLNLSHNIKVSNYINGYTVISIKTTSVSVSLLLLWDDLLYKGFWLKGLDDGFNSKPSMEKKTHASQMATYSLLSALIWTGPFGTLFPI